MVTSYISAMTIEPRAEALWNNIASENKAACLDGWFEEYTRGCFIYNNPGPYHYSELPELSDKIFEVLPVAIQCATFSSQAAEVVLLYELDRMRRHPRKMQQIIKNGDITDVLFCTSRIKDQEEKNLLYQTLSNVFKQSNHISIMWFNQIKPMYRTIIISPLNSYSVTNLQKSAKKWGKVDITPNHNNSNSSNHKNYEYLADVEIGDAGYTFQYGIRKSTLCFKKQEYFADTNVLIAVDQDTQERRIFPLLPMKGDTLQEQLFLDSLLSLIQSELNNYQLAWYKWPFTPLHMRLITILNKIMPDDSQKKDLYKSIIDSNIVKKSKKTIFLSILRHTYLSTYKLRVAMCILLCLTTYNMGFLYLKLAFIIADFMAVAIINENQYSGGGHDAGHAYKNVTGATITLEKIKI
jgi:hypothetical protein